MPVYRENAALMSSRPDLRPKRLRPNETDPSDEKFVRWAAELSDTGHQPMIVVPKSADRVLKTYLGFRSFQVGAINELQGDNWLTQTVLEDLTLRISRMRIQEDCMTDSMNRIRLRNHPWEILWGLITSEDFVVEEPLRGEIDGSSPLLYSAYRLIWEVRFIFRESGYGDKLVQLTSLALRWFLGQSLKEDSEILTSIGLKKSVRTDREKIDVLLFLLALAAQNGLCCRVVMAFNNLEKATQSVLRQLSLILDALDNWTNLGCPVGIVFRFDDSKDGKLPIQLLRRA